MHENIAHNAVQHQDAFNKGLHRDLVTAVQQVVCYVALDHKEKDQTRQA